MNNLFLIFECGPPGSGKSTHAKTAAQIFSAVRLSSDELRAKYGTGEGDQSVSNEVFRHMEISTDILLSQGRNVLIDATNKNKWARGKFVRIARKYGARTLAFVNLPPLEVCLARNMGRQRKVPDDVIIGMYNSFETPLPGEVDEVKLVA